MFDYNSGDKCIEIYIQKRFDAFLGVIDEVRFPN